MEEQRPHLSRCPVSANQKPGLGGSDQSEARKDRAPDRCPEIQNTLIRGEREESRLNLTAFNEPKPRHLLTANIGPVSTLWRERGSMHCYVCIYRLKSLNVSDTIFICFRQLFCNNVLSNG